MNDLATVEVKLNHLSDVQDRCEVKISEVRERLYNPDDGLFYRVHEIQNWSVSHQKEYDEFRNDINELVEMMKPIIEDFAIKQKRKPMFNKILASVIGFIIIASLGFGWTIIKDQIVKQDHQSETHK